MEGARSARGDLGFAAVVAAEFHVAAAVAAAARAVVSLLFVCCCEPTASDAGTQTSLKRTWNIMDMEYLFGTCYSDDFLRPAAAAATLVSVAAAAQACVNGGVAAAAAAASRASCGARTAVAARCLFL